jgi:hypothetical protein
MRVLPLILAVFRKMHALKKIQRMWLKRLQIVEEKNMEAVERVISAFKFHQITYDKSHPKHKRSYLIQKAWNEISRETNLSDRMLWTVHWTVLTASYPPNYDQSSQSIERMGRYLFYYCVFPPFFL